MIEPSPIVRAAKLAYRVEELHDAAGIGRTRAFELIREGKLKARKDGANTIVLREDLEAYLHSLPLVPSAAAA
jgi:hypothetical protein